MQPVHSPYSTKPQRGTKGALLPQDLHCQVYRGGEHPFINSTPSSRQMRSTSRSAATGDGIQSLGTCWGLEKLCRDPNDLIAIDRYKKLKKFPPSSSHKEPHEL